MLTSLAVVLNVDSYNRRPAVMASVDISYKVFIDSTAVCTRMVQGRPHHINDEANAPWKK